MIDIAYFTALIFVFLRMISFFAIVPLFSPKGMPNAAKVALAGIMSYMLLPGIDYASFVDTLNNNYTFIMCCIAEVATGLTLGYITSMCFSAVRMAGQLMDIQIGFGMVNQFDSTLNTNSTLIENFMYWFSVVIFFIVNGHLLLVQQMIDSFKVIKLGQWILSSNSIMVIIQAIIQYFAIGIKIALPVILIVILTDITMGLISRTVTALNVMVLGLPVKILVGLICISFALPVLLKLILSSFSILPNIFKAVYKYAPLIIIFASEEKTEDPTEKKKSDARKKGQVAKSKDVNLAFNLLASTLVLVAMGKFVGQHFEDAMSYFIFFTNTRMNFTYSDIFSLNLNVLGRLALILLPMVVPLMLIGIVSNFIQVGFLITTESLKPSLDKLNPISGFKRIFSARSLVGAIKDIIVIIIPTFIGYYFIKSNFADIMRISNLNAKSVIPAFGSIVINIFFKITLVMIGVALLDFLYQKYTYKKDLKMTKQEVKEEFRQQEGDPQIKGKIRQKQREMSQARMMQKVPEATVVITNPTHVAVALKYDEGKSSAPYVIAKGLDMVALKIKEVAKENEIPIMENKPLARLIYEKVDIDSEIPAEMYQAVAEILALVYKLNKKK